MDPGLRRGDAIVVRAKARTMQLRNSEQWSYDCAVVGSVTYGVSVNRSVESVVS